MRKTLVLMFLLLFTISFAAASSYNDNYDKKYYGKKFDRYLSSDLKPYPSSYDKEYYPTKKIEYKERSSHNGKRYPAYDYRWGYTYQAPKYSNHKGNHYGRDKYSKKRNYNYNGYNNRYDKVHSYTKFYPTTRTLKEIRCYPKSNPPRGKLFYTPCPEY